MKKQVIKDKFLEFYPKYTESVAYTKLANWLADQCPDLFDKAAEIAENAQYNTSKRGNKFLTTATDKVLGQIITWEAARYPKSAALIGFALKLAE